MPHFAFVDFGLARFRYDGETDLEWRLAKFKANEEDKLWLQILFATNRHLRLPCLFHGQDCRVATTRYDESRSEPQGDGTSPTHVDNNLEVGFPSHRSDGDRGGWPGSGAGRGSAVMTSALREAFAARMAAAGDARDPETGPDPPPECCNPWWYALLERWPYPLNDFQRKWAKELEYYGSYGYRYPVVLEDLPEEARIHFM